MIMNVKFDNEEIMNLLQQAKEQIDALYVDFKPTIPIDYASRWRDAYNLSRLIAGRGDEYGKTWIAYRSKPKRSE